MITTYPYVDPCDEWTNDAYRALQWSFMADNENEVKADLIKRGCPTPERAMKAAKIMIYLWERGNNIQAQWDVASAERGHW